MVCVVRALQFDGSDDYVSTDSVLNPADGVFSVLAWVVGGAPGQVVVLAMMVFWVLNDNSNEANT